MRDKPAMTRGRHMGSYIPLLLSIFLLLIFGSIEHSIMKSEAINPFMTYGLSGFVCVLWALGMFVIGATYETFGSGKKYELAREKEEKSWSYF
jgi:hypothetical protein